MKFLAVLKREYKKVVFTWAFLITTFLMPLVASLFIVVPVFILSIEGDVTRIAVADKSGKIAGRFEVNLTPDKIKAKAKKAAQDSLNDLNASQEEKMKRSAEQIGGNFEFVNYNAQDKSLEQIKRELNARISEKKLDAYVIIP
ncbi:MAG: hypothetical protein ACR2J3_01800, partial [Aridibacter sp.]